MPAFQGANLEPGNRVSGRVSARVFLQGFERPYGWGHSGLTGTKHGTSLQSAEPSGVARPPNTAGSCGPEDWVARESAADLPPSPGETDRGWKMARDPAALGCPH